MMPCHFPYQIAAALALALLSACSDDSGTDVTVPAHELVVTTADFEFRAPQSVPAGLTRIRLRNEGPEPHHVQLVRLADGHTIQQLVEQLSAGTFALPWATYVGGANNPAPGGESEVTLTLGAGQYAMICLIPSADGVPHFAKGMVLPLTVTASSGPAAPEPAADLRMVLNDYSFSFTPELAAGRRSIRVENDAAQPHEIALFRLTEGKTVEDLLAQPPIDRAAGHAAGGTTAIAPGGVNFVTADFAPGDYALLCFIPDAADGKPHVAHGMARQVRVN